MFPLNLWRFKDEDGVGDNRLSASMIRGLDLSPIIQCDLVAELIKAVVDLVPQIHRWATSDNTILICFWKGIGPCAENCFG